MEKRGQVFLIAAIVTIGILAGVTSVFNRVSLKDDRSVFFDLSEEIEFETKRVLDYGVYNSADTQSLASGFLEDYASYIEQDQVVFILGDSNQISALVFQENDLGSVGISTGGTATKVTVQKKTGKEADLSLQNVDGESTVNVLINEINYDFRLREGQNFFFVIIKEENNEKFVAAR